MKKLKITKRMLKQLNAPNLKHVDGAGLSIQGASLKTICTHGQ